MADALFRIVEDRSVRVVEFYLPIEMDALALDAIVVAVTQELERKSGGGWVLDLTHTAYLNSAGLGLLVNIRHRVRESRGRLAVCGLSARLLALFHSCCLEQLFTIIESRHHAIARVA